MSLNLIIPVKKNEEDLDLKNFLSQSFRLEFDMKKMRGLVL